MPLSPFLKGNAKSEWQCGMLDGGQARAAIRCSFYVAHSESSLAFVKPNGLSKSKAMAVTFGKMFWMCSTSAFHFIDYPLNVARIFINLTNPSLVDNAKLARRRQIF